VYVVKTDFFEEFSCFFLLQRVNHCALRRAAASDTFSLKSEGLLGVSDAVMSGRNSSFQLYRGKRPKTLALTLLLGVATFSFLSEYNVGTSGDVEREVECSSMHVLEHWPHDLSHIICGCVSPVTVVTAYFNVGAKSKHDEHKFLDWNSRFFLLADDMVIFTDVLTSEVIFEARKSSPGCTIIFEQQLFETELSKHLDWNAQHSKDVERHIHSPELYIIWNQKSLWLAEVASSNPYRSDLFFWADSGQFRDDAFLRTYVSPDEKWISANENFPTCKMLFLAVEKFRANELVLDRQGRTYPLNSSLVRLGGGNFGGDACAVAQWRKAFMKELEWYLRNGAFVGKDQPIYGSACISHIHLCFLVDGTRVNEINDIWFAMQPVLHGVTKPIPQYDLITL
jgi:hypothetical protein